MEYIIQHYMNALPSTPLELLFHIVVGLIVASVFGSFFEFVVHKYVMHLGLPLFGKKVLFPQQQHSHAVLHHGTYYKKFDHEDDPVGKEESILFTKEEIIAVQVGLLPAFLVIAWFSPVVALCFSVVAFAHNNLWNIIHHEMHQPEYPSWTKWSVYRFLARHHFLHHRHTGTNYNVVFPFADYVLNRAAKATPEDLIEITRLGYQA